MLHRIFRHCNFMYILKLQAASLHFLLKDGLHSVKITLVTSATTDKLVVTWNANYHV